MVDGWIDRKIDTLMKEWAMALDGRERKGKERKQETRRKYTDFL